MNVKFVYPNSMRVWDTRADGSASTSCACIQIDGISLLLWSKLKFEKFTADGKGNPIRTEDGNKEEIARLPEKYREDPPATLADYAAAMCKEYALLRFDIDGETIWQYQPEQEPTDPENEQGEEAEDDED